MKKIQFAVISAFVLFLFFVVVALFAVYKVPYEPKQRLLVLMLGGFRHDYVLRDQSSLIGFPRLQMEGVRAEYLIPVFPSDSYPNWFTAATGLHSESHGVFTQKFLDRETNKLLVPNQIEPIWTRAIRKGFNATVLYWDGCQIDFVPPDLLKRTRSVKLGNLTCIPHKDDWNSPDMFHNFTRTLYSLLDDFAKDRLTLAMVHYPLIDTLGHKFGPDSNETIRAVRDIDMLIYNLLNQRDRRSLQKTTNIYVLSDHGMSYPTNEIKLREYVDMSRVKVSIGDLYARGRGTFGMIWPVDEKETDQIYDSLHGQDIEGLHVYLKDEIPFGFHVKLNKDVWPIMIRAHPGYYIDALNDTEPRGKLRKPRIGFHGYFPDEFHDMYGIMYAAGPSFRKGFVGEPLWQVDHYQLFCHMLKIRARPNNGTWSHVRGLIETY